MPSNHVSDPLKQSTTDNSQTNGDGILSNINPRLTYIDDGSGIINHYVDQISDIDSSPDQGFHNKFADLTATDSTYDNITETLNNVTLINAESFESTWPPGGWSASGRWNRSNRR